VTIDPVDTYDATPQGQNSDTYVEDASDLDEAPLHSFPDNNSGAPPPLKDPSPVVKQKRGRPRRQIPAVETNSLKIELKRELRRRRPTGLKEATPAAQKPDTEFNDTSALDESPAHSFLDGNAIASFSAKSPSPTEHPKPGRLQHQTPAIETDPLKIDTRGKQRKGRPSGAQTEDPWVILSKTPSITPSSPVKPCKARLPIQKHVINLPCCLYKSFILLNISHLGVSKRKLAQQLSSALVLFLHQNISNTDDFTSDILQPSQQEGCRRPRDSGTSDWPFTA
jgi:hypothetical protein